MAEETDKTDETAKTAEDLQRDEDLKSAVAIVRMIDALEKAHPERIRRIEQEVVWVLARRAGWMGHGDAFIRYAHRAVMIGEDDRREDEAKAAQPDPSLPQPTTESVGHA